MKKRPILYFIFCLISCACVFMTGCKGDQNTTSSEQSSTPPTSNEVTNTPVPKSEKPYEVTIDPSSLCYQHDDKGNIVQLRFTSDGSRIKGVYNNLTQDQSKMLTGVITGFISNDKINSVYSYRIGTNTTRQGLVIEKFADHIIITHPDENGRTVKLPLVDCATFKR